MKKILLASASAVALFAAPAMAQDIGNQSTVSQTGDSNQASVDQTGGTAGVVNATQTGDGHSLTVNQ